MSGKTGFVHNRYLFFFFNFPRAAILNYMASYGWPITQRMLCFLTINDARLILRKKPATVDSCFDLVESHQHGVASNEVISCSTDIHILTKMVMTSDETQIHGCKCWLSVWTV